jgi:sterol O-acyltransferase
MAEYYRNWNLVVHEWLYAYVYRDLATVRTKITQMLLHFQWTGTRSGQKIGQTLVFFLSAAFHEYWFGVSLRLFYPIMFNLYFVCGGIFFCISRLVSSARVWNAMMYVLILKAQKYLL